MGVTLDAGAMAIYQRCLQFHSHPFYKHIASWSLGKIAVSTPSVAWAEYWRGRSSNVHFVSKLSKRIRVAEVCQHTAESAAEALRKWPGSHDRNSVKHLIDAIVMAHANDYGDAVYTTDIDDFVPLWEWFPCVKSVVSATTGDVVLKR